MASYALLNAVMDVAINFSSIGTLAQVDRLTIVGGEKCKLLFGNLSTLFFLLSFGGGHPSPSQSVASLLTL